MSRSARKRDDAVKIKDYWERHKMEGGGILHDILQYRNVDDVDLLWGLSLAMKDRDPQAIMICGYLMSILDENDRSSHLTHILGWPTS